MSDLTIAVDLDDVSADRLRVIAAIVRSEGAEIHGHQPLNWDLSDWGVADKAHYDRLHYTAFVHRDGYRTMPPVAGAVDGILSLHEMGLGIRIVTGRLWTAQVVRQALGDTGAWIAAHDLPIDDIAFVSDKTVVNAAIYVEDAPHFIRDLQRAGREVIIMSTPYNKHLPGVRAAGWADVTRLIRERFVGQLAAPTPSDSPLRPEPRKP